MVLQRLLESVQMRVNRIAMNALLRENRAIVTDIPGYDARPVMEEYNDR